MAEQDLPKQLSAAEAAGVVSSAATPTLTLDSSGTITMVNEAWLELCEQHTPTRTDGYVGQSYTAVCEAELALETDRRAASSSVLGGSLSEGEFEYFVALAGRPAWFHVTLTPLADNAGVLVRHYDVTEAKMEGNFEQLLESPMDALMIVDTQGQVRRVNARFENLFGYARGDLIGQSMDKLLPERFRARHKGHQAHFFADPHARPMGTGLELSARHQSGAEFPVEISLTPLRGPEGNVVVAAIRDLSERRAAEVQLAQLGEILETSLNEIYLFDARTLHFALVNRGARDNLGYSMDELRTLTPLDLKPDFTPATFSALLEPLRSGHKKDLEFRTRHCRKDGSSYPAEVHLQLYEGEPAVFIAIIMDISQRVRDEGALRETEQRLALHVKETPLAVVEWRLEDHLITAWNPAAERIFGYRADEMVGQRSTGALFVGDDTRLQVLAEGTNTPGGRHINRNRTKDGRVILCEWYTTLLKDASGAATGGAALALDVTSRQRAVDALLTAQDAERVRISRDLHDGVGQALTAVNLGLQRLQTAPDPAQFAGLKELVGTTLEDVRRISRDLRPALLDELGLEAALNHFARALGERSATEIDVLARLSERLPRKEEATVYRVVQEALTNVAKHAQATYASVVLSASEHRLHLVVEDNGKGFDLEKLSTKDGVGLSGMRERVELLGGALRLESTLGRGTIISVRLPLENQVEPTET